MPVVFLSLKHYGLGNSRGNHSSPDESRDLVRVDFIVFDFPASDGFHVESVTQDERDPFPNTPISNPIPGRHILHSDNDIPWVGFNQFQKSPRLGTEVPMNEDIALLVKDTDKHPPCMRVDSGVIFMPIGVESCMVCSYQGL